jgi:hypothetical protein
MSQPAAISTPTLRRARLHSLLLAGHACDTPGEVVAWFGAMQAQDLASAMWSFGARLPGSLEVDVTAAVERAEVLRTWPMRGTIHFVPPADAEWMLALTGSRALAGSMRRREQLGLQPGDAERAADVLESALAARHRLTRAQALAELEDAGISTQGQRGYHLLWYAAQTGVTCIGPQDGTQQTFVLLREWAPRPRRLERSEAVAELAYRYFRSHGPVSVRDFAGWTGLTLTDARAGLAANEGRLTPMTHEDGLVWLTTELADRVRHDGLPSASTVLALPGFDEYMLGYKDRRRHADVDVIERVVPGGNGMFRATLVADGRVVATWRRVMRAASVEISVEPFAPMSRRATTAATRALTAYAGYLGRSPDIRFEPPAP